MTEPLLATLIGIYLTLTLPPVIIVWRRGRPAGEIRKVFLYSVLLGWTVLGYLAGWVIALESDAPAFRIDVWIDVSGTEMAWKMTSAAACETRCARRRTAEESRNGCGEVDEAYARAPEERCLPRVL